MVSPWFTGCCHKSYKGYNILPHPTASVTRVTTTRCISLQVLQGLQQPAASRRKCYKGYNNPLHPAASATRVTTTCRIPPQVLQGLQQPAASCHQCYKGYNN